MPVPNLVEREKEKAYGPRHTSTKSLGKLHQKRALKKHKKLGRGGGGEKTSRSAATRYILGKRAQQGVKA